MAKTVRNQGLDKFYTLPAIARECLSQVNLSNYDLIVEPSAGNSSFFNIIDHPHKIGIDISPECNNLVQMDFFNYTPQDTTKAEMSSVLFFSSRSSILICKKISIHSLTHC